MAGYGIPDYGYGDAYSQTGVYQTPGVTGAQNPMGAYMQQNDPWVGLRGYGTTTQGQSAADVSAPKVGSGAGGGSSGSGWNMQSLDLVLGGLQTIGNLWNAWQANKLAKEQFKVQRGFANANLENSVQAYNTTLEDRGRSRAYTEGQDAATAQAYIDNNRLDYKPI